MTLDLKRLISDRQQALTVENPNLCSQLRNKVHRAIKQAKPLYFQNQIKHIKTANPGKWWKAVKKLSGYNSFKTVHSVMIGNNLLEGENH